MKNVMDIKRDSCTGCMMCGDVCPKHAIAFNIDLGFWYPVVDRANCIDCGLCVKKCPVQQNVKNTQDTPVTCFGAKSKDNIVRYNSSSGGVFTELAKMWIHNGGVCVGAVYDANLNIVHAEKNTVDGIQALRQSKYAQSETTGIYRKVQNELEMGNKVMFCGTPCQVEALYAFIGHDVLNLVTVDFVCYGICSPVVYRKYLDWLENRFNSKIKRVWFKNKKNGWRSAAVRVDFEDGKTYLKNGSMDPFMRCFFDDLSMRESCYKCKYRKIPHASDFTLADFWGIENVNPKIDDNQGVSAIIVNTERGLELFNEIKNCCDWFKTSVEKIAQGNSAIYSSKEPGIHRHAFLKEVEENSFDKVVRKFGSYHGKKRLKTEWAYYKSRFKTMLLRGRNK